MGLKDLLGKGGDDMGKGMGQGPHYDRIHRWIESKIGPIDISDPGLEGKLNKVVEQEKARYPSARSTVTISQSGFDTVVSGDTKPFKRTLKRLGLHWERKSRAWVGKGVKVSEADLDTPSKLAGLKRYVDTVAYRAKFKGPDQR